MLYVQQSLAPDEELVHIGRFHWFYDVQAVMNIVWGLFFSVSFILAAVVVAREYPNLPLTSARMSPDDSWLDSAQKMHAGIKLFSLLVFIIGVMKFAQMLVIKATTEIAITTTRLIYKRGLVARNVGEMNIDRIEGISIDQSLWGRIFNFGRVIVRGMGVGELYLPQIADPVKFRRAIEKARTG